MTRLALIFALLLLSIPAAADRYWDVPRPVAEGLVAELPGNLVIEHCAGCGDIFTVYRVDSARVAKGDYSPENQVLIKRTVLMSGVSQEPLKLQGSCGKVAEHVDLAEEKLDIPYTWVERGGVWTWLGQGTSLEGKRPATLTLATGAEDALRACAGGAGGDAVRVRRAGDGWRVTAGGRVVEVEVREKASRVDRTVKGKLRWVDVTGVEIVLQERGKRRSFIAPTLTLSGSAILVEAFEAKHGLAFLVDMNVAGSRSAFVLFTPQGDGYLAHLLPSRPGRGGDLVYDRELDRVRATLGRFPVVDDLNLRREPPSGDPVTKVNRGDFLQARGEARNVKNRSWIQLAHDDGRGERLGYTVEDYLTPLAPLYSPTLRRWITVNETEASFAGLAPPQLTKLRGLAADLEQPMSPEALCKLLPRYEAEVAAAAGWMADVWMDDSRDSKHFTDVLDRLSREVPGAEFAAFSEGVSGDLMYSALAARLTGPKKAAATDVLRAGEALFGRAFPIWLTRTWDLGGCREPSAMILSVKLLARSWSRAPPCLKEALEPRFKSSLQQIAASDCFCKDAKSVKRAVKKVRGHLEKLEAFDGAALSRDMGSKLSQATFSSQCADN